MAPVSGSTGSTTSPGSPRSDSTPTGRESAGRHRRAQAPRTPRRKAWLAGALGLGTALTLGAGTLAIPTAAAQRSLADSFNPAQLDELLTNDLILDYLEVCRSTPATEDPAGDATDPAATPADTAPDTAAGTTTDPGPVAVADCSGSDGNGTAVVLPDNIELGSAAEKLTVDLGDDINILGKKYELGERNLFEILSAAALGSDTVKDIINAIPIGNGQHLPRIDPSKLGEYSSYEQVRSDAALPVDEKTERYCDGFELFGRCIGSWKERTYDANLKKRQEALKIAEYLTGHTYDASAPVMLPELGATSPQGSATVSGDGVQVAAAMRNGSAVAEARKFFGLPAVALAGADKGRSSIAHSDLGISTALNMDTDEIGLTWFGQPINFDRLKESGITDLAGDEASGLLDTAENLSLPALKEVSCFGLSATATAEGLGSCTNILGTFDTYEDLRDPVVGESRQSQVGITDLSSLVLGNDALVKQLTGKSETTPFLDDLAENLTSEEGRLKFAKDFVRFTRDVRTEEVDVPVLDEDGQPVLDEEGNPKTEKSTRETTAAWLTSDYGLREPVTVEWLGHRVVFFPAVEVNGTERPNILGTPEIEKITEDADAGLLPKISLVTWDNAFGLGTVTLDDLSRPDRIFTNWAESVTLPDDLKWIAELAAGDDNAEDETTGTTEPSEATETTTTGTESTTPASSTSATPAEAVQSGTAGSVSSEPVEESGATRSAAPSEAPSAAPSAAPSNTGASDPEETAGETSSPVPAESAQSTASDVTAPSSTTAAAATATDE